MTEKLETSSRQKIFELLKHGIIYGLTSSLQSLLGFIMLPILTSYYTPDIFGVYSILLLLSAISGVIFYLGASSALGRFYNEKDSKVFKRKVFTSSLLISLIGGIIMILFGIFFSKILSIKLFGTEKYSFEIILILIGTAINFQVNLLSLVLRYEKKSILYLVTSIASVIINFSITYVLLSVFKLKIEAPLYGLLFSNLLIFAFLIVFLLPKITLKIKKSQVLMILNFGIQASIASVFFYILEWVDRLIIKDLLNLSDVGVYSLGYRLGSIFNVVIILPFFLVWAPMRMKYVNEKNNQEFTSKVVSYFTIAGLYVILLATLFGDTFVHFFFKNKDYYESAKIFPLIMFSLLLYGYQNILDIGLYLKKKMHYYILIAIVAIIINVLLNYWLIPYFGYIAAAYTTIITYLISSSLIYFFSNKFYKISIEKKRILFPIVVFWIIYIITSMIYIGIIIKLILSLFLLFLIHKFWLNQRERIEVNKKIGMLITK